MELGAGYRDSGSGTTVHNHWKTVHNIGKMVSLSEVENTSMEICTRDGSLTEEQQKKGNGFLTSMGSHWKSIPHIGTEFSDIDLLIVVSLRALRRGP